MDIRIEYNSYNQRRYSRPWISKVTNWPAGQRPTIEWGQYEGDDNGGEVVMIAQPGDIIRHGQKDNRGNNSSRDWYIVSGSGELAPTTEAEAHKSYNNRKQEVTANA